MKPFTSQEMQELPKGYTPAETPGRKFFRDMKYKRILIVSDPVHPGQFSIIKQFTANCRRLTTARIDFKSLKFGRLHSTHGKTA